MEESQPISILNTLNPASQRKHSAIIERLCNPKNPKSHSDSSQSSHLTPAFLDTFAQSKLSIQASIDQCRPTFHERPDSRPNLKSDLDNISSAVTNLEKLLAENSYFLPSYELRSCLKSIAELKESLESTSCDLLPRKKFSFRNKPAKKNPVFAVDEAERKASKAADAKPDEKKTSFVIRQAPGFQNMTGGVLVKRFTDSADSDFALSDLESCEVRLLGRLRALFIHRLRNCRVFAGPVLGSIHIDEAEGCLFMLASHQIRIHAKATDFYLRVRSRPIIEDSSGVRFAPYALVYEGIEQELKDCGLEEEMENWANVDDFRWLRAVQSPNWCVLPEEDRVATVRISDSAMQDGDDDGHSFI